MKAKGEHLQKDGEDAFQADMELAMALLRSETELAVNKEELEAAEEFRKKAAKGPVEKSLPALHKKMSEYESNGELLEAIS